MIVADPGVKNSQGKTLGEYITQSGKLARVIPCSALGKATALTAVRPDIVKITGVEADFETGAVYIALSRQELLNGEYTALLSEKLFENNTGGKGKDYASISEIQA